MKASNVVAVAQKKPNSEMLKKRKAENKKTSEKVKKTTKATKDSAAPKRPAGAFFVFMEDFRKSFKENCPNNKSISVVGKAGGEKWKAMSDAEKAPYANKAQSRKAEYEKALEAYKKKLNGNIVDAKPEDSGKSSSEVHDYAEQEASS